MKNIRIKLNTDKQQNLKKSLPKKEANQEIYRKPPSPWEMKMRSKEEWEKIRAKNPYYMYETEADWIE